MTGLLRSAGALLALAILLGAGDASAQPRARYGIGFGAQAGEGRLILRTRYRSDRPDSESTLLLGLRLHGQMLLRPRLTVEATLAGQFYVTHELPLVEIGLGGRAFWPIGEDFQAFYLRPHLGLDVLRPSSVRAGFGFGLAIGYSKLVGRANERFVELAYVMRVVPDVSARFSDATFGGYGYHPEYAATLFASFLGIVGGMGFGLGRR